MITLKQKIELLPTEDSTKKAVVALSHITPAIISNIQGTGTLEALTEDVLTESLMYLLSDFDAEIGKQKQIRRFYEIAQYSSFGTGAYTVPGVGTLVAEELLLAQPLAYSSLRIRRVFVNISAPMNDATIRVLDSTGATTDVTADLVAGLNRIEVSAVIDTDLMPARVKVGVLADGVTGFRSTESRQLGGYVRRADPAPLAWCQWELVVDMNKVANAYADELAEAYQLRAAVNVMDRHIKSQNANRSTLVGREELANNRAELNMQYERILTNAARKIYQAISLQPATNHKLEFDRGYSVGSVV